jgi:hypothetical protein
MTDWWAASRSAFRYSYTDVRCMGVDMLYTSSVCAERASLLYEVSQ